MVVIDHDSLLNLGLVAKAVARILARGGLTISQHRRVWGVFHTGVNLCNFKGGKANF